VEIAAPVGGSAYRYAAADLLTLPSLERVPLILQHGGAPPVGLADLAEAMLTMGNLWPEQWNGELVPTMNECLLLWSMERSGQEDGLETLTWWDLILAQDLEAMSEYLYDAGEAKTSLRERLKLEGRPMAAFALQAATDRDVRLGDSLTRLAGHLRSLGIRPYPALGHLMGVLTLTVNQLGGWTPQAMREQSMEREEWAEEVHDENYLPESPEFSPFSRESWDKLPEWLFSGSYSTAVLNRIERKLRASTSEHSLTYWVMARAAELARQSDVFKKCKDFDCHLYCVSYEAAPSLVLQWMQMGEMDAIAHFIDNEFDMLWQSEHHTIEWLYVFDPTDPDSCRKASAATSALLGLVGALDRFLVALDKFAQSGPVVSQEVRVRV
jgi:hypothetical protein